MMAAANGTDERLDELLVEARKQTALLVSLLTRVGPPMEVMTEDLPPAPVPKAAVVGEGKRRLGK